MPQTQSPCHLPWNGHRRRRGTRLPTSPSELLCARATRGGQGSCSGGAVGEVGPQAHQHPAGRPLHINVGVPREGWVLWGWGGEGGGTSGPARRRKRRWFSCRKELEAEALSASGPPLLSYVAGLNAPDGVAGKWALRNTGHPAPHFGSGL